MTICCYTEITHQWNDQDIASKVTQLPEKLQQQAMRKRQWIDRQLAIGGKILLMRVLKELGQQSSLTELEYNNHHRPYIHNAPDFNIAHSGNIVICCGTDKGQIGIDIEEIKEIDLADYTDYFTQNEWEQINSYHNRYDGFYNFWTRKEALLKAIGTGFHTPLSSVDVSADVMIYDDIAYHIQSLNIHSSYKCHLATTASPEIVIMIQVDL